MNKQVIAECLSLLKTMKGNDWSPAHDQTYGTILSSWSNEHGKETVMQALMSMTWRPSVAELARLSARIVSPYPDDDTCYAEIIFKLATVGPYGVPDPNHPNVMLSGPPRMSHPIVSQIVAYCGGWKLLCSGEANFSEGLKKQIRAAHASIAGKWELAVAQQLRIAPNRRDMKYFPNCAVFDLPDWFVPGHLEAPSNIPSEPDVEEIAAVPMPSEVREMLNGIGKSLP